jgi:hypothetical protein
VLDQHVVGRLGEGGAASGAGAGGIGNSGLSVLPRAALVPAAGDDGGSGARVAVRPALGAAGQQQQSAPLGPAEWSLALVVISCGSHPLWFSGGRSFASKMQWVPPFSVSDLIASDQQEPPDV